MIILTLHMKYNHQRHIDNQIKQHFKKYKKVLILLGARQVGKTTLLKRLFPDAQYLLVDNESIRNILERYDISAYRQLINPDSKTVILDEIHLLANPGRAIKIIFDQLSSINLIITGSSSLSIKNKTTESLAGRKIDYHLFPLTFSEYLYQTGIETSLTTNVADNILSPKKGARLYPFDLKAIITNVLRYGLYPELVNSPSDEKYLENLSDSVVFKDLLELKLIENRASALALLKLLAYQIGNLINYSEIGGRLNLDARTVKRYMDIFEQSFIVFRLYPFSTRPRDEIGKTPKIYFYDLGLRNALIGDFSEISLRSDRGALFENFIIGEFLKLNFYLDLGYKLNYWRLKQGSEIDLVLAKGEELTGVEIKYSDKKIGAAFTNRYPRANVRLVTSDNFY